MDYFYYNTDVDSLGKEQPQRHELLIKDRFAAVGGDYEKFGKQLGQLAPEDILLMYENRVGVIAFGRVLESWDKRKHTSPKYYLPHEMNNLTGGAFEYRIAVDWFLIPHPPINLQELRNTFDYDEGATITRGTVRKIVKQRDRVAGLIEEVSAMKGLLPGEIHTSNTYCEGVLRRVLVNAYERSREAVLACKAIKKTTCVICGFDFGARYGADFNGFIHIHHTRPLSQIREGYEVDPETDLEPVCPNCHAVIHYGGQLRSIDEVRKLLQHNQQQ